MRSSAIISRCLCCGAMLCLCCALRPSSAAAQNSFPPAAAVLEFEAGAGASLENQAEVTAAVETALGQSPSLVLIDRPWFQKMLGAETVGPSGLVDSVRSAWIGRITGVPVLITGRVFRVADNFILLGKIMSTRTNQIFGEMVSAPVGQPLGGPGRELAAKIAATVGARKESLLGFRPSSEERLKELGKFSAGNELPGVILEAAAPPALEAGLSRMLAQLGLPVAAAEDPAGAIRLSVQADIDSREVRAGLFVRRVRVSLRAAERGTDRVVFEEACAFLAVDSDEKRAGEAALDAGLWELIRPLVLRLVERSMLKRAAEPPLLGKL